MYIKTVTSLGLAVLIGLQPAVAMAAQPQGNWRGMIEQRNTDVAVQMDFVPNAVRVRFNEPLSCNVTAKFLKEDGATSIYRFSPSINGGRFCDSVLNRDLRFTPADKQLNVSFDSPRNTWQGRLQPVPSP
jgi:hypothetical protein